MKVKQSQYLINIKPSLKQLVELLSKDFDYVSVLATDVSGTSYNVGQRETRVSDYGFGERGFVCRVYQNDLYSEYSFNMIECVEELAEKIKKELKNQLQALLDLGITKMESPLIHEDNIIQELIGEVEINAHEMPADQILARLKECSDAAAKQEGVIEAMARMSFASNNKMFISNNKDLMQSFDTCEGMVGVVGTNGIKTDMAYTSFSGLHGAEIMDEMLCKVPEVLETLNMKLSAESVVPGMYDVITSPEVSGLIAHEAFGHGVEMDMFVKERALAKDYINEYVASEITGMKDGAKSASQVSSYLFDDEGVLGSDTTIIENGILKAGISDLLSALRLNTTPTGNGKRESFERKAYARMTNTIFTKGTHTLDEMIASIDYGYLLEGMDSGMEDPKHWGIQCIVAMGREIKNGKFTGKVVAPVCLTGYVPDLLKSITMVSNDMELFGSGACGKGHKEWVKVSDGGPYLKCKVRLG